MLENTVAIPLLYFQGFLLGLKTSMTLVSGVMATVLDGELLKASYCSQAMHTIRNYSAAMLVPVIAFTMKNNVQKSIRSLYSEDIKEPLFFLKRIQGIAIIADHKVFYLMIMFNIIMLVSSIIQILLGKGRRITSGKPSKNFL